MPLSWNDIKLNAMRFSEEWLGESYERGEAQTFYNEFFGVFGVTRRSVARFEEHVRLKGLGLQWGFIDLLWPGVLIVEHKSLGGDLERAAQEAGAYFDGLSEEDKPRYQLVCDFETFSLLDRDSGQKVEFSLVDLHKHIERFAFILGKEPPKLRPRVHLNQKAAALIAGVHKDLRDTKFPSKDLESFLTRLVYCLFADSTGIFEPRGRFADLIESRSNPNGSDLGRLLHELFQILDTRVADRQAGLDPELLAFPYINGNLFGGAARVPGLNKKLRTDILAACEFNWSEVSPAIFGELFQSILSREERRDAGAFSTSEQNILKVVEDLFLRDLREELDELCQAGTRRRAPLEAFRQKLSKLTFFDPACGCGNFLVIAYRELRKLELAVLQTLDEIGALESDGSKMPLVDVDQFYGIERYSYSARIAEAAMWMTDHIANNELSLRLKVDCQRVPLLKTPHIASAVDALKLDWKTVIAPDVCSFILGNPPYKGAKQQTEAERERLRSIAELGGSGGTLDLVCGWILKAAEYAEAGTRIGLVTVNSVVQGEQVGQLWPILFDRYSLELEFAHQSFKWRSTRRGDSQVQVIVLGLVHKHLIRPSRRLYRYQTAESDPDVVLCEVISPYLIVGDDLTDPHVTVKETSTPKNGLPRLQIGTKPIDGGYYILSEEERQQLVRKEPATLEYIRPFLGGSEFLKDELRYILVLHDVSSRKLRSMPHTMALVKKVTDYRKAMIKQKGGGKKLTKPNELWQKPTHFHVTKIPTKPFLVIPEVTSERREYMPIGWIDPPTVPSNLVKYTEEATLSQFALLTSAMHMTWLRIVGGRLEGRTRYSIHVVYNTFPVIPNLDRTRLEPLARNVLEAREEARSAGNSLEDMYRRGVMPDALKRAHAALDREVDRQYLGHVAQDDQERIVVLLNSYHGAVTHDDEGTPSERPYPVRKSSVRKVAEEKGP